MPDLFLSGLVVLLTDLTLDGRASTDLSLVRIRWLVVKKEVFHRAWGKLGRVNASWPRVARLLAEVKLVTCRLFDPCLVLLPLLLLLHLLKDTCLSTLMVNEWTSFWELHLLVIHVLVNSNGAINCLNHVFVLTQFVAEATVSADGRKLRCLLPLFQQYLPDCHYFRLRTQVFARLIALSSELGVVSVHSFTLLRPNPIKRLYLGLLRNVGQLHFLSHEVFDWALVVSSTASHKVALSSWAHNFGKLLLRLVWRRRLFELLNCLLACLWLGWALDRVRVHLLRHESLFVRLAAMGKTGGKIYGALRTSWR